MGAFKTIEVQLRANIAGFSAGMGAAAAQVRAFGSDLQANALRNEEALKKLSTGAMVVGTGMLAGFGLAAGTAANFDAAMDEVGATAGATSAQLGLLRESALQAGASTVFSASEAAKAQAELAKAGVSTSDIMGGALAGSLDLAAAGGLDLAAAAEVAATSMGMFGLSGKDVPHIADALAAGANKSAASVDDLGQALNQSGLVAAQLGIDLDTTTGTLSMFSQAGLRGSDAGTSLKTMLQRLVPQSAEAADEMERLGLKFFDANGQFVGLEDAARQLKSKMSTLKEEERAHAMQVIFGSDAVRAANLLYREGAEGVAEWTSAVNDNGYAAELAAGKTDNLRGDIEELGGAWETGLIRTGERADGVLRGLTQTATNTLRGFEQMPPAIYDVAAGFTGVGGGVLLTAGAVGKLIPKWNELTTSLNDMGLSKLGTAARGVGVGFLAAAPGVLFAAHAMGQAQEQAQSLVKAMTADWEPPQSIEEYGAQINTLVERFNELENAENPFGDSGFVSTMRNAALEFVQLATPMGNTITDAKAARAEIGRLIDTAMPGYQRWSDATQQISRETGLTTTEIEKLAKGAGVELRGELVTMSEASGKSVEELAKLGITADNVNSSIDDNKNALLAYKDSITVGSAAQQNYNNALDTMGDNAASAEDKINALNDSFRNLYSATFGESEHLDRINGLLNQLPSLAERVRTEAGGDFAGMSDAAIQFRDVERDIASASQDLVGWYAEHNIVGDQLRQKMDLLGLSLLVAGDNAKVPRDQLFWIQSYVQSLPNHVGMTVTADTSQAEYAIGRVIGQIDHIGRTWTVSAGYGGAARFTDPNTGETFSWNVGGRATGGPVDAGRMYEVNETGAPELLNVGQRQFLMMGAQGGHVTPLAEHRVALQGRPGGGGAGGTVVNRNVSVEVHAPNYVGDKGDLAAAVASPEVVGRLTEAIRRDQNSRKR